jgi:hypothetical protein
MGGVLSVQEAVEGVVARVAAGGSGVGDGGDVDGADEHAAPFAGVDVAGCAVVQGLDEDGADAFEGDGGAGVSFGGEVGEALGGA